MSNTAKIGKSGGRRSTTWKPGTNPVKKKGTKHKKTLLKERVGLKNWEGFAEFVENQGSTKLISEMKKLKGRDYVMAFQAMTEFVKPKLARQEVKVALKGEIKVSERPVIFK